MKIKPVFKNVSKARIQIIRQGIPHWLEPGDTVTGERYRVYLPMGLKEVGRQTPTTAGAPIVTVDDVSPAASPVTVRAIVVEEEKKVKIDFVDDILPIDVLKFGTGEELKSALVDDIGNDLTEDDIFIIDDEPDVEPEPVVDNYPHKCQHEGCDRAFASKRGLKSHSRVHKS